MIKHRICILLNQMDEYDFEDVLNRYLPQELFDVIITDRFPKTPCDYRLIILWNYTRIIKLAETSENVVVMHASNLPEGRGWAPIYYTFKEQQPNYFISCIFAAKKVDAGDVIARASFTMKADYTASFIRKLDNEISILLIYKIIEKWGDKPIKGLPQEGTGSYRPRRYPEDSEIDPRKSINELLPHLRGLEMKNPGFFYFDGIKYLIEIRPECEPVFPPRVLIEYPAIGQTENWSGFGGGL